jgi:Na+/melibiose symporter-like transporter
MFLEYATFGAMTINSYYFINVLGLSGFQVGLLLSTFGIGILISSVITSKIAYRFQDVKLFKFYHFLAALSFFAMSFVREFDILFGVMLLNGMALAPTMGLANSITFSRIESQSHYSKVRVWGTIGFLVSATGLGIGVNAVFQGHPEYVYAGSGLIGLVQVMFVHFFFGSSASITISSESINAPFKFSFLLKKKIFLLIIFIDLGALVIQKFGILATGANLGYLGVSEIWIMPLTTVNQYIEILALAGMTFLLLRASKLTIMFVGLISQALAYFLMTTQTVGYLVVAMMMGGLMYPFVLATAQMLFDENIDPSHRTSIHQIYMLLTVGVADLVGNWVVGGLYEYLNVSKGYYGLWWQVGCLTSIAVIAIAFGYKTLMGIKS